MAYLEVKNFNKNFSQTEVLRGVSFTAEKGEVVALIGSSGAGKTTLLRCLNFLESPDEGEMKLDGETLLSAKNGKKESDAQLRKKRLDFGLVFQSFHLFPQYTVLKNITLAPMLLLKQRAKELRRNLRAQGKTMGACRKEVRQFVESERRAAFENGEAILEQVGLIEKAQSYPHALSGGQQQRVAIARALALKPKVLCFDEPTSALDPELTGEVLKVIRSLKNDDRTMIIVTHEMEFARGVADKIIFMADGVIEEAGAPEEIFKNPKSEKLKNFLSYAKNKEGGFHD